MPCEILVTVKDENKSLKYKFLIYEPLSTSDDDPIIKDCVEKSVKNFGEADELDIRVKINLFAYQR